MKKLLKLCVKIAIVLAVLGAGALLALRLMFPPEKLKAMAVAYAKDNLQREISFDGVSLNLVGVTLDNFALSENTTFQNGTFVKADKLVVKIALLPLLKKRVEIATIQLDGLAVQVIKNKDGSFNFDTLIPASDPAAPTATPAEAPAQASSGAFVLLADKIAATDCDFSYQDLQTGMKAAVNDLNIEINNLDLAQPFDTTIRFTTDLQQENGPGVSVPVTIALRVFLADLDLPNAYVTVNDISASYKTVKFTLKGGVKNFTAPQVDLTGSLSGINNKIFADFLPNLPNFSLPVIHMTLKAAADLEKSTAGLTQAKLSVMDSALTASGNVGWGGATPTYTLAAALTTDLSQIVQMTDTVAGFNPGGIITGSFKATEKLDGKDISGSVTLKNVSALYEPITTSNLNGTIVITSLDNIACNSFTGLINGEKFTSSFSYKNVKDVMNILFKLDLAKLTLSSFPSSTTTGEPADEEAPKAQEAQPATGPEMKMNIQADVKVGPISVPYFRTDGFTLNANLTGVSESMTKTNGQVSFKLAPGAITDLDLFVKENKIVKILLLPITIVRRVAGMLNVDLFPAENEAKKGEISFTNGEGLYTFTHGLMKLDKTVFNSKLTNLNGTGNLDFNTQKLDMKVSATVLTSQTPIVIKIGGTMDNPSGKLDVLNTVGSLVGGILNYKTPGKVAAGTANLAGNVASGAATTTTDAAKATVNAAKDALKGIGALFKKKETSASTTTDKK